MTQYFVCIFVFWLEKFWDANFSPFWVYMKGLPISYNNVTILSYEYVTHNLFGYAIYFEVRGGVKIQLHFFKHQLSQNYLLNILIFPNDVKSNLYHLLNLV